MAATTNEVCDIIDTSLTVPQLEAMLATAENLIVAHIDPKSDPLFTSTVRDNVKVWLAAHFVAIRDPQVKEESADGVRSVFRGKTDMGLKATLYGQQAMLLDPTGALAKIDESGIKRMTVHASTPRSEFLDL